MFTLFFAGREFAPKAIINDVNIQDYLESHYFDALAYLARKIHDAGGIEDTVLLGWETINDPSLGLVGCKDLSKIMQAHQHRKTTCPSPFQCMLGGQGEPTYVTFCKSSQIARGKRWVDPGGLKAWLSSDYDEKYHWKRDPGWKLDKCLWAQHGVWNPETRELVRRDYFRWDRKGTEMNEKMWTKRYFMSHIERFTQTIRDIHPNAIIFIQPPPLFEPPVVEHGKLWRLVYSPHFYDGLTLNKKRW